MKATKQKKMAPKKKEKKDLYAAVDLHGDNGLYCIINGQDKRVFQQRLPNDLDTVLKALAPYRERLVHGLAVEATFNWYWLVDGLQAQGYGVQLVNTTKVQTYSGLKQSNDQTDAFWLAHLQRLGLLPTAYIYPKAWRGVRDMLRRRMLLVQQRTAHVLSFKSLVQRETGQHVASNTVKGLAAEQVGRWVAGAEVELMGQTNVRLIGVLETQIKHLEQAALAKVELLPNYARLQELPGVGRVLGLVIMLETGAVDRFANAGHYVSYCRGVKSERLSNERKKGENNRKCGNRYLDWAYVEAANFAIRHYPAVQRWYERKRQRCGGLAVIALKAVAAKLAKAAYYLMKNQEAFNMKRIFG